MVQLKAMWTPDWEKFANGADAQKVANEIFAISDKPTKEQIVDMARDPKTESNKLFEWNDTIAAERYRKEQAGWALRHLKVEFIKDDEDLENALIPSAPVRLFYGDPIKNEGFVAITTVLKDNDMYQSLLEKAKSEIKSFRVKYSVLKELKPLFDVIDEIK